MPNFETPGEINLQENDELGWDFYIPPAASSTVKGGIPYGRTVASVVVTAFDADGLDVTTDLISGTPTVALNIIYIIFKYPVVNGDGRYKVTMACTLDNGRTRQFDFGRIIAENL